MRLGCCGTLDHSLNLKESGFDFIEVNIQKVLQGNVDDDTWNAQEINPDNFALPVEVANCLLPSTLPVIGDDRNLNELQQYMERVTRRAKFLGIKVLVFGSGAARRRPEQFDKSKATNQLIDFCRLAGDACGESQVQLVIEHLNRKETNTINSLSDEKELIDYVNHPCVTALVDTYHYGLEGDSDQDLLKLNEKIQHVHVAEVVNRYQPGAYEHSNEAYNFKHFFALLQKINYSGRVSIEAKWRGDMDQQAVHSAKFIRGAWANARL